MNTICCIGDSLTYGKSWSNGSDLAMPLNVRLAQKFPRVEVVNLGVNADSANNISTTRKTAVDIYNPFAVVVWCGINDISSSVSAATLEGYLQTIYTYYHTTKGYYVYAVTITQNDAESSAMNTVHSTVNTWIKNTATGIDKIIDAWTVIASPSDNTKRNPIYADPNTPNHFTDLGMTEIVKLF